MRAITGIAAAMMVAASTFAGSLASPTLARASVPQQEQPLRYAPIPAPVLTGVALLGGLMVASIVRKRRE